MNTPNEITISELEQQIQSQRYKITGNITSEEISKLDDIAEKYKAIKGVLNDEKGKNILKNFVSSVCEYIKREGTDSYEEKVEIFSEKHYELQKRKAEKEEYLELAKSNLVSLKNYLKKKKVNVLKKVKEEDLKEMLIPIIEVIALKYN